MCHRRGHIPCHASAPSCRFVFRALLSVLSSIRCQAVLSPRRRVGLCIGRYSRWRSSRPYSVVPNCVCGYVCDLLLSRTSPGRSLRSLLRPRRSLRSRSPRMANRHRCCSNTADRQLRLVVHKRLLRASVRHIGRTFCAFQGRK